MSQRELAEAVGLPDDGTVARIERGNLRASEALLRRLAHALDLELSELTVPTADSSDASLANPYKGLASFRESDAELYFGRTAVSHLVARKLAQNTLVAVIGASGSGKSSLVAAGVLPMIRSGRDVAVVQMRPGGRPFDSLAVALHSMQHDSALAPGSRSELEDLSRRLREGGAYLEFERLLHSIRGESQLTLVIDQFEELFTQCRDPDQRRAFVDVLLELTRAHGTGPDDPRVLLVLRGDFFSRILEDRSLAGALQDNTVHLPPMSRSELEEAIARPAASVNCQFEHGLVSRIVDDAGDEPGRIPLVQYCLSLLWAVRAGTKLTMAAYDAVGGLDGAIASQAERVFVGFGDIGQRAVRRLMTRLIRVADIGGTSETRRTLPVSDVATTSTERDVLEALIGARLLTTDFDGSTGVVTVELAHEAVIGHWARLQDWLMEDRQFLLWQQRLELKVKEWIAANRDESLLLRGKQLADSESWMEVRFDDIGSEMREFLLASMKIRDLEATARTMEQARFLLSAQPDEVPRIVQSLRTQQQWIGGRLGEMLPEADPSREWRVRLALLELDDPTPQIDPLVEHLLVCAPEELDVLLDGLKPYSGRFVERLWRLVGPEYSDRGSKLRAACALSTFSPANEQWERISSEVAELLVSENPLRLLTWIEPLKRIRERLTPHLRQMMGDYEQPHGIRDACALVLLQFTYDDPEMLARITAEANRSSFSLLFSRLQEHSQRSSSIVRELRLIVDQEDIDTAPSCEVERLKRGSIKGVAAIMLARMEEYDSILTLFEEVEDPEAATQFVHQCRERGATPDAIAHMLLVASTTARRYWLTLALGEFALAELRQDLGAHVVSTLEEWYATDTASSVHSAVGWLLASWGCADRVRSIDSTATPWSEICEREWFTLSGPEGPVPFVRIPAGRYSMGCDEVELGAKPYETPRHDVETTHSFALCAREVTRAEYERFVAETGHQALPNIDDWSPTGEHPVVGLTWFEACEYLEWVNGTLGGNALGRLRLPTEAEWEYACRAGSLTAFSFGSDRGLLRKYAWFQENSDLHTHPFRTLRPNRYGLFNIHGNTWEWCSDWYGPYKTEDVMSPKGHDESDWRVLRGGCWNLNERYSRSACRNWHIPTNRNWYIGLRPAWTFSE